MMEIRNFRSITELTKILLDIRKADANHDLHINKEKIKDKDVYETIPTEYREKRWSVKTEDMILSDLVYSELKPNRIVNQSIDERYIHFLDVPYVHNINYKDDEEETQTTGGQTVEDPLDSNFFRNGQPIQPDRTKKSLIEEILDNTGVGGNVFFHVDISKKKFKKDLTYVKDRRVFWVNSKTQNYDPAGKTTPSTQIGNKLCGFENPENENLFFCWEDTSPGISSNIFYPRWENKYDRLEDFLFSKYNIYMLETGDPYNYDTHETKVIITDPDKPNKYVYSDKNLSNKNGSNISKYSQMVKNSFNIISKFLGFNSTDKSVLPFDNSSLVISKFLGDTSQYLFSGLTQIHYKYSNNRGTVEDIISNKNNAFVSFDRIAIAGALNVNTPIVVFDRGETFDIFILREIADPRINFKEKYFKNNQFYETLYSMGSTFQELNEQYKLFRNDYLILKNRISEAFTFYNITDDDTYKGFLTFLYFLITPISLSSKIEIENESIDFTLLNEKIKEFFQTQTNIQIQQDNYLDINNENNQENYLFFINTLIQRIEEFVLTTDEMTKEEFENESSTLKSLSSLIETLFNTKKSIETNITQLSQIVVYFIDEPRIIENILTTPKIIKNTSIRNSIKSSSPFFSSTRFRSSGRNKGSIRDIIVEAFVKKDDKMYSQVVSIFSLNIIDNFVELLKTDIGTFINSQFYSIMTDFILTLENTPNTTSGFKDLLTLFKQQTKIPVMMTGGISSIKNNRIQEELTNRASIFIFYLLFNEYPKTEIKIRKGEKYFSIDDVPDNCNKKLQTKEENNSFYFNQTFNNENYSNEYFNVDVDIIYFDMDYIFSLLDERNTINQELVYLYNMILQNYLNPRKIYISNNLYEKFIETKRVIGDLKNMEQKGMKRSLTDSLEKTSKKTRKMTNLRTKKTLKQNKTQRNPEIVMRKTAMKNITQKSNFGLINIGGTRKKKYNK